MCKSNEEKFLQHGVPKTTEVFDNSLFKDLCDAHCHAHDDRENLQLISELKTGHITLMGVRQDDWDIVSKVAKECNQKQENKCIPSFGVHPWFSHFLMVQEENDIEQHYKRILTSKDTNELEDMLKALNQLPTFTYDVWYNNLRQHLLDHPKALVGEVGIDKAAKLLPGGSIAWHGVKPTSVQCSVEHQMLIFDIQCKLARELNRGISVHCVQGQGPLFNYLKAQSNQFSTRKLKLLKEKPNTLRMCLHSYGGAPGSIKQFLELKGFRIYVSFSVGINARMTPAPKLQELIRAVPEDRLLIESDLDSPKALDACMVDIVQIVAEARQWSIAKVVEVTHQNWIRFQLDDDAINSIS